VCGWASHNDLKLTRVRIGLAAAGLAAQLRQTLRVFGVRQYDLDMSIVTRVLPFVALAAFTVGLPIAIFQEDGPPRFLIVPFLAILAWQWWVLLSLAHRIVIDEDGTVEWIALARRVSTRPESIQEISPDHSGGGFFRMIHSGGKVRFLNQITGFHEVVAHIKAHNPTVVLKGC